MLKHLLTGCQSFQGHIQPLPLRLQNEALRFFSPFVKLGLPSCAMITVLVESSVAGRSKDEKNITTYIGKGDSLNVKRLYPTTNHL
jgi:hypothetical protein